MKIDGANDVYFSPRKEQLERHTDTIHNPNRIICPKCDAIIYGQEKLEEHLKTHEGQKPYLCPTCLLEHEDGASMMQHIKVTTITLTLPSPALALTLPSPCPSAHP